MSTQTTNERTTVPAGTYTIDAAHSSIGFHVRHLMVAKVRGRFTSVEGDVRIADDPRDSTVEIRIDASSIDTADEKRDGHLRSPDFLDVENHPEIVFRSTEVDVDGDRFTLAGELTIRGTTEPVLLRGSLEGTAPDPQSGTRAVFSATGEIDRELWGMTWNQALETGGVMVSKKVTIELDVVLVNSDR